MEKIWIVVANASHAVIYDYTSSKSKPVLTVIDELTHADSRKKDSELVSDREGEYRAAGGHGNFVESSDPHKYEAFVFARQLSRALEQSRQIQKYQALTIVAGPHFMGLLRQCMSEGPLKNMSIQEVVKDYSGQSPHELIKLLDLK